MPFTVGTISSLEIICQNYPQKMYQKPLCVKPMAPLTCNMCCQSAFAILYCDNNQPPNSSDLQQRFISHSYILWLWVSCGPAPHAFLYSQNQAERVAPIWKMFDRKRWRTMAVHAVALKPYALVWDVSILLTFHLLKQVTWVNTDKFGWEEYFSQREMHQGRVPVSTICFKQTIQSTTQ